MTNVEKFKEVFDIEVVPENTCLSESCLCHECSHHNGARCRVEDWWYAEYQGEPTIALSVIEKITTEIQKKIDENLDSEGIPNEYAYCYESVLEIIDKAVKEIEHETN